MTPYQKQEVIWSITTAIFIAFTALAILCGGCASIQVETPDWKFAGSSLFKSIEVPLIVVGQHGEVVISGYKGNVDGEALGIATAAAIKTIGGL